MKWFRKNKSVPTIPSLEATLEALPEEHKTSIEIVAHKTATKEVLREAKKATEHLNELLVENGFTLKIYLAAGGTHRPQPTLKKGNH